ncbi:hypothetical protein [Chelatococcus sp.]|uniref:hypothetical protein n=1 Tax=Chelatococcus sp. TaxID=1953771 RepID=UPI0025C0BCEC|nr:hypothetical protein [Chelatococcus sp.]
MLPLEARPWEIVTFATTSPPDLISLPTQVTPLTGRKIARRMPAPAMRLASISCAAMLAIGATLGPIFYPEPAMAQEPVEAAACRKASIETLRQVGGNSPLKDVKLDLDSLTIAKANAEVGGVKIHTVLIGQAAIQRENSDEPHTFLCLLGEKEKVLMTFFTKR